ncbi:head completion/stabilization protein [Novosphingobium sp. FSY-8]|uniref:Head completion/stabilization protein n=1 Tax=Novosphingobium ovatum TaxID=1908523 RepID=A0ABW9XAJ2_9SPHN|nr:head completion/stabilization protein [Novosphingobium ovatum]NBC35554.1 head completion/stabilization protein [Novosphingobium ovatum]
MTGLIATPIAPPDTPGASVAADGWFPAVALADVRAHQQLGGSSLTESQLMFAVEGAMLTAMRALATWRADRIAAGADTLADATTDTIGGQNLAVRLWTRAVALYAAADLAADNRDITATDSALTRAAEKDTAADELRRKAHAAIADLLSIGGTPVPRNRVSLI